MPATTSNGLSRASSLAGGSGGQAAKKRYLDGDWGGHDDSGLMMNGRPTIAGKFTEKLGAGFAAVNQHAIQGLKGHGDKVSMRTSLEGREYISPHCLEHIGEEIGDRRRDSGETTITQVEEGATKTYCVRVERHALYALINKAECFDRAFQAELDIDTCHAVEMVFDHKNDVERAVGIIQRIAVADALASGRAPSNGTFASVHVTPDDIHFLRANVSAVDADIGGRGRLVLEQAFDLRGGIDRLAVTLGERLCGWPNLTRRITLPKKGMAGRLTYVAAVDLYLSAIEKNAISRLTGQGQDRLDHGRIEFGLHADLPPGWSACSGIDGKQFPGHSSVGVPVRFEAQGVFVRFVADWCDQSRFDLGRDQRSRLTMETSADDLPDDHLARLRPALSKLLHADQGGSIGTDGILTKGTLESIERDGLAIQGGFKLDMFVVGGDGTVILETGFDDIIARRTVDVDQCRLR